MIKIYRAAADIPPVMMKDYFVASSDPKLLSHGEHTVGHGMYFAVNKDLAKTYGSLRKPHQYFTLGTFKITGDYKVYDNLAPETIDTEMMRLEGLIKEIRAKQNQNFIKKYGKPLLQQDDFLILSEEEIEKISKKQRDEVKQQKLALGVNDQELDAEGDALGKLYWQAVKMLNNERLKYDISIFDYEEVCIHNPEVTFELVSFDLYFNTEAEAERVYHQIKAGTLSGSSIKDIDEAYAELASKVVAIKQP
jgi:hypothetical protein